MSMIPTTRELLEGHKEALKKAREDYTLMYNLAGKFQEENKELKLLLKECKKLLEGDDFIKKYKPDFLNTLAERIK